MSGEHEVSESGSPNRSLRRAPEALEFEAGDLEAAEGLLRGVPRRRVWNTLASWAGRVLGVMKPAARWRRWAERVTASSPAGVWDP